MHNNANVLSLGARILAPELAFDIVDIFLSTNFEGGRHQARLDELHDIEVEESAAWADAQEAPAARRPVLQEAGESWSAGSSSGSWYRCASLGAARRVLFPIGTASSCEPCCAYGGDAGGRAEVEGWGECTALPGPTYSAEYTAGAVASIRALPGAGPVVRQGGPRRGYRPRAAAVKGPPDGQGGIRGGPARRRAPGRGCEDGRLSGGPEPVWQPAKGAVVAGVAVGLASSIGELLDEVERYVGEGYRRVKLKITPGWDDEPLGEVRRRWPELVLFADANGTYAEQVPAEAAARLARLDGHGLACIEQPLGDDDLAGHRELARQLRTPVCLDEALTSVASVIAALDMGACSVVNVKAGRLGGYLEAVRVHDLCADRGVPVWCGGMVETGVGRAANVALASLPNFSLPGDLSASGRFFEHGPGRPPSRWRPAGPFRCPQAPAPGLRLARTPFASSRAGGAGTRRASRPG